MNKQTIVILTTICLLIAAKSHAQYPTFNWAKAMGGSGDDFCRSVAFDASGNV